MGASKPPSTPASKVERTPMSTPTPGGSSRAPTPGGSSRPPTPGGSSRAKEEKIFVTVRVRPLSKKELAVRDDIAWECADSQTIIYKGPSLDRAAPTSYTFDKVFGPACQTDVVYEEGAKDVAMSALTGINATIFAYGQTSSGKTFTMRGVTESAVSDIYRHIDNTPEREFVIKISAMEIYNEVVKDLLRPDSGPLRLLDDPEKGTIVEKLQEEIAKDSQHLRHLISICEEQRQVGETALNDTSSRSHQIIRLTLESRLREVSGCVKSFVASLNFVDLAGSERAAQTHAIGARLKEGCHINRSLLTLTTVIRKLSSEKRSGHIPYRDSKLTRILQLSLGGNARTAIICTMSPALTHVEQSRNTLFFATCAKEVTNTAKVNMVVSDKQLVKHLQTEVARLEAELRTPDRGSSTEIIIMERDRKIRQMEIEMEELKKQRDNAQSQLEELRKKMGDHQPAGWNPFDSPQKARKCLTFSGSLQPSNKTMVRSSIRQSSTAPFMLKHEIRKLEQLQQQLEVEANRAIEVLHKEVECHKHGNQDAAETIAKLQAEIREMQAVRSLSRDVEMIADEGNGSDLKDEISRLHMQDNDIAKLEAKLENVQRSIERLAMSLPNVGMPCNETTPKSNRAKKKKKTLLPLGVSNNINRANFLRTPCSPHSSSRPSESEVENRAPEGDTVSREGSEKATPTKSEDGDMSSHDETPRYRRSSSVNMKKMQRMFQNAAEENVRNIRAYVTELKERVAKLQYQKQLLVCQVLELESNEGKPNDDFEEENAGPLPDDSWDRLFKEQMQHIIQLWDVCQVSIIHRTQFYLLFRGDRADQIYIEVEVRRLTWLQQHFAEVGDASPVAGDDSAISLASSFKALRNEREFLARRMGSRLTDEERERLFIKWQVPLEAKQRKLQLVNKLWTDPNDQAHIEESADIVARLVGFCEGGNISKEMFELNFAVPTSRKPWLVGWQPISNMIREKTQLW
ncbi:hypothetical protein EJB05_51076 [Eragrostis curvula]|uniref:Kinesin-like protein n=1 Tax=Eragrostis curvula TaxID=38414 RepID=A0A5J9SWM3_9POAL|nr:hypothetical protein EJB05_51076 [Eragrostis curvula]